VINFHFHDDGSSDGQAPLPRHCEAAVAAGVIEICVTNHAEILGPDGSWQADLGEMRARFLSVGESVREARRQFPELGVRLGIELEYRPEWTDAFDRLTHEVPFDFVLGSVHMVEGHNVSGGSSKDLFFEGRTQKNAYSAYFRELDAMVEWGGFDVVAHFDLVKRFGHRHYGPYEPHAYRRVIQPVLDKMAARGLGIEINTSGVTGPGVPYPEREILSWARQAGVPTLTLGTDSHRPETFADGLAEGALLAKAAGWEELTLYEGRKPARAIAVDRAVNWAEARMDSIKGVDAC
jgi:histidinol-phosphatase (PHP family)